jgi:ferredoxin
VNLLVAGERAGLHIKHGCRQGICHECTCRLRSGTIQDLSTGLRIEGEGQPVRLCVSAAMSDLDLESLN